MKFCDPHWERLREAIRDRGLEHLVARSGEQAARNTVAEFRGGPDITSFDPLMAAHNGILVRAMHLVGLVILAPNDDGSDRCPQCFLNEAHERECIGPPVCMLPTKGAFDHWTDRAADMAKEQYDDLLANATPQA